eukprot:TRINITY_DN20511_c0_g1_i1.p2 TRINITY_DN20511_c0_g1~~TRINITY_DN20511_c0_g1_i1.p2  ORF type:complete len:163 (-),score=41.34 TRINITY_DN20511_c0_g1_i1:33-479(-)
MAQNDVAWEVISHSQNSFFRKQRSNGIVLTCEPGNPTNIPAARYGLAARKSIDVRANAKGGVVVSTKSRKTTKPGRAAASSTLTSGFRTQAKSVKGILKSYAPRLQSVVLARVSQFSKAAKNTKKKQPTRRTRRTAKTTKTANKEVVA